MNVPLRLKLVWDALLLAFHPHSHQVVSAVIAEAASTILQGPDHDTTDPAKAFRKWDAAVGSLNQNALDLPPLDAKMLSTCLMVASLHASKEDSYYQAYLQLQATLQYDSAKWKPGKWKPSWNLPQFPSKKWKLAYLGPGGLDNVFYLPCTV